MAQIRSKQIKDFLTTVNWGEVTNAAIPNASDVKNYVDTAETELTAAITAEQGRASGIEAD